MPNTNIVRIDLVLDNTRLSSLLEKRGNAIKNQNYTQLKQIEDQIEKNKEIQYNADVVGAFVTYETELELRNALSQFSRGRERLSLKTKRPPEPASINWKNMRIKTPEKTVRSILVFAFILAFLYLVSFQSQVMLS